MAIVSIIYTDLTALGQELTAADVAATEIVPPTEFILIEISL